MINFYNDVAGNLLISVYRTTSIQHATSVSIEHAPMYEAFVLAFLSCDQ